MQFTMFQGLESRTLLSAATHKVGDEPTPKPVSLDADRAAILADIAKFKTDMDSARSVLTAARQKRDSDSATVTAQLKVLTAKVSTDDSSKSIAANLAASVTALHIKWSAVLGPDELAVKNDTGDASADKRTADKAKLDSDRAAANAELAKLTASAKSATDSMQATLKADKAAVETARKYGATVVAKDVAAVSVAEKSAKSVFQSDKLVVDAAISLYKHDGGKMDGFTLPTMPTM